MKTETRVTSSAQEEQGRLYIEEDIMVVFKNSWKLLFSRVET